MRRATLVLPAIETQFENFYPRSPCGERRYSGKRFMLEVDISIHALLAESDGAVVDVIAEVGISIHALLAESDVTGTAKCFALNAFLSTLSLRRATWRAAFQRLRDSYFYPRSPCGERPRKSQAGRAGISISIHALLAESDDDLEPSTTRRLTFLSTLSLRRATSQHSKDIDQPEQFLSTLSLRRATLVLLTLKSMTGHFYPRSPCGERQLIG